MALYTECVIEDKEWTEDWEWFSTHRMRHAPLYTKCALRSGIGSLHTECVLKNQEWFSTHRMCALRTGNGPLHTECVLENQGWFSAHMENSDWF